MTANDDDDDPISSALRARNEARDLERKERQHQREEEGKRLAAEAAARDTFIKARGKLDDAVAAVNKQLKEAGEPDTFRLEWRPNPGIQNVGQALLRHLHPKAVGQVSETLIVFGFDGIVHHQYRCGSTRGELDIVEADFFGMNWQALLGEILIEDIDRTK